MNFHEFWERLRERNGHLDGPDTVKMSPKNLEKLLEQTWNTAQQNVQRNTFDSVFDQLGI